MQYKNIYEIYTDASFERISKLGTYAIVICKNQKVDKVISEKIFICLNNSTECEIFAMYQAILIISEKFLKHKRKNRFILKTDCTSVKEFFNENKKTKLFRNNFGLYEKIKESYNQCKAILPKNENSLKLKCIPRKSNNLAHKYSYSKFNNYIKEIVSNDCIILDKECFFKFLQTIDNKQIKVISYLFTVCDSENIIVKTQFQIANELNMTLTFINRIFKKMIEMKLIEKVKNGIYILLIR